jgi:hypothetical protein
MLYLLACILKGRRLARSADATPLVIYAVVTSDGHRRPIDIESLITIRTAGLIA